MDYYVRFAVGEIVSHTKYPDRVCKVQKIFEQVNPPRYNLLLTTGVDTLPLLLQEVHPMFIRAVETLYL